MQSIVYWFRWFFTATLPAGRLLGIPLRVHVAMLVALPIIAIPLYQSIAPALGFAGGAAYALLFVGILWGSVLAHEFGHAWGHRLVGGETDQIILTPIGGLAIGTGGDRSPKAELIVVALGPAVSVVLALVGHGVWLLLPGSGELYANGSMVLLWVVLVVGLLATLNTFLAIFNLLFPLFPMDAARLWRAGLSLKFNPHLVTLRICQLGVGLGIALLIAFFLRVEVPFFGNISIWLVLIGVLGIQASLYEQDRIRVMSVYSLSDNWGGQTVYYDRELFPQAKAKAAEDLRKVLHRDTATAVKPLAKPKRKRGPAKVIDISQLDAPEDIDDPEKLGEMMREAANSEDFLMAARIQRRLRYLRGRAQGND